MTKEVVFVKRIIPIIIFDFIEFNNQSFKGQNEHHYA
jgi:hypothetical protein